MSLINWCCAVSFVLFVVFVIIIAILMNRTKNKSTIIGGGDELQRHINVISSNEKIIFATNRLRDNYDVSVLKEYPKFNDPAFITITDMVPECELPSTYILLLGNEDIDVHHRIIRVKHVDELFDLCKRLSSGELESPPKTITKYNVGEHLFTKKPPSSNDFNYNQLFGIWVDNRDTLIKESAQKGVPYEKYMTACLSAFIEPNSTILDVGTNVGTVSLPLSRLPGAKVVSFEPFPDTYAILFKNVIENDAMNIVPLKMSAGDKNRPEITLSDTVVILPHYQDRSGSKPIRVDLRKNINEIHFGAVHIGKGDTKTSMTTIDELRLNISAMKVDVEGAEPMVFYGARETIKRCMPVIVFEKNEKVVDDGMRKVMNPSKEAENFNVLSYCRELGYKDFYELDIQDYMLVPPNRKQIETKSIAKFKKVKQIKGYTKKEVAGFRLHKFDRPRWKK